MSRSQTEISGWSRLLAAGLAGVLAAGAALAGIGVSVAQAAGQPVVTVHPAGQTVSMGGTAQFTAAATSAVDMTVKWQSTKVALPNGEPDGSTWVDVPGADAATLTVAATDADAQHGAFYRAVFTNGSGSASSYAAQLRFFEKLDASASVTVSGESYGPIQPNTPFSVSAPNAVVKGRPIVISGTGYLATDGTTGSVANFMVDASYSGDPNTLSTTREIINPVTGQPFADKRSHGVVQANADGTWQISIPWPDETNTTRDASFFASNWTKGTQHIVRILTGSLLSSPADYQRGISVRFTIVDPPAPPGKALTKTPTPTISGTGKVGKTLKAKAGTWKPSKVKLKYQWLRDGEPIAKATKSSYKLAKADAGRKITVRVTGSKSGYVSVAKTSKAKSVAKVKAKVKLSLPKSVARGVPATAKVTVSAPVANPTGIVTVKVSGQTLTVPLTADDKGKLAIELPAIAKKGKHKVKASFKPDGATAASTSSSSTVTKKLKVR